MITLLTISNQSAGFGGKGCCALSQVMGKNMNADHSYRPWPIFLTQPLFSEEKSLDKNSL